MRARPCGRKTDLGRLETIIADRTRVPVCTIIRRAPDPWFGTCRVWPRAREYGRRRDGHRRRACRSYRPMSCRRDGRRGDHNVVHVGLRRAAVVPHLCAAVRLFATTTPARTAFGAGGVNRSAVLARTTTPRLVSTSYAEIIGSVSRRRRRRRRIAAQFPSPRRRRTLLLVSARRRRCCRSLKFPRDAIIAFVRNVFPLSFLTLEHGSV